MTRTIPMPAAPQGLLSRTHPAAALGAAYLLDAVTLLMWRFSFGQALFYPLTSVVTGLLIAGALSLALRLRPREALAAGGLALIPAILLSALPLWLALPNALTSPVRGLVMAATLAYLLPQLRKPPVFAAAFVVCWVAWLIARVVT